MARTECCTHSADGPKQEQGLIHHWGIHRHLTSWRNGREEPQGTQQGTSWVYRGRNASREGLGCSGEQNVDWEPAMCLCSKDGHCILGCVRSRAASRSKEVTTVPFPHWWGHTWRVELCKRKWTCWSESSGRPQRWLERWNTIHTRRASESWCCSAQRQEGSEGSCPCMKTTERESKEKGESGGSERCPVTKSKGHKLKHKKFYLKITGHLFIFIVRVVEQVVTRCHGDIQNVTGNISEQPTLADLAFSQRLDHRIPRAVPSSSAALWLALRA